MAENCSPELQEVATFKRMCDLPAGIRASWELALPHSQETALVSQLLSKHQAQGWIPSVHQRNPYNIPVNLKNLLIIMQGCIWGQ